MVCTEGLFFQAKSLVCAPMENCYSNLMHDDGKGILSLILSLIGLNVNYSDSKFSCCNVMDKMALY